VLYNPEEALSYMIMKEWGDARTRQDLEDLRSICNKLMCCSFTHTIGNHTRSSCWEVSQVSWSLKCISTVYHSMQLKSPSKPINHQVIKYVQQYAMLIHTTTQLWFGFFQWNIISFILCTVVYPSKQIRYFSNTFLPCLRASLHLWYYHLTEQTNLQYEVNISRDIICYVIPAQPPAAQTTALTLPAL
jgi:hypothetical protein